WLGVVGPGVNHGGRDDTTWSDHADIVPTMMGLTGLKTDYVTDGAAISEAMTGGGDQAERRLATGCRQVNAPYGDFNHSLIVASTKGISADDAVYLQTEQKIQDLTSARDALAAEMRSALNDSRPGRAGHQEDLVRQGTGLLAQARALAG